MNPAGHAGRRPAPVRPAPGPSLHRDPESGRHVAVLRVLLFVFPCAALAMALPEVPHWFVVTAVVLCAALWARQPDHLAGGVGLVLVLGWWSTRGLVDWRVLVVGVLVVSAHVVATVLAHGPPTLAQMPIAMTHLGSDI